MERLVYRPDINQGNSMTANDVSKSLCWHDATSPIDLYADVDPVWYNHGWVVF